MSLKTNRPLVYVPAGAEINLKNDKMTPPKTKYEKTRTTIGKDAYDKVIGKGKKIDD